MNKVKMILLVDDNQPDNEFHEYVIEDADKEIMVKSLDDSRQALKYFENCLAPGSNGEYPVPDMVFLDINMPAMTGFELLDKLRELPDPKQIKKTTKIFMLTGSLNPDDLETATKQYADLVSGFHIKPLTVEMVQEITEKYFS